MSDNDSMADESLDSIYCITDESAFRSAGPVNMEAADIHDEFLVFLGIAQQYKIDFLPMSWERAQNIVGAGATAEIRQSQVNQDTSYAFKNLNPNRQAQMIIEERRQFRALTMELSILGYLPIRQHRSFVTLEGIGWDISPESGAIWPFLIFERAKHGDLCTFMRQRVGREMSFKQRLSLCHDIGDAVSIMHALGIIHGDIKPQNVLIYDDDFSGGYSARLTDFGFSTLGASSVVMPRSEYWGAPEWHRRGFSTEAAMKMDTYSFGLLCCWLLFYNTPRDESGIFYDDLRLEASVSTFASKSTRAEKNLSKKRRRDLLRFFQMTLAQDPANRSSDISDTLVQLCIVDDPKAWKKALKEAKKFQPLWPDEVIDHGPETPRSDPKLRITSSIGQFYEADYRIRRHIATCLEKSLSRLPIAERQSEAFELALCYKLGFGVLKNDERCAYLLDKSGRELHELDHEIAKAKEPSYNIQEGLYSALEKRGYKTTTLAEEYEAHHLDDVDSQYRREITDVERALGTGTDIGETLKMILCSILWSRGQYAECERLLTQFAKYLTEGENSFNYNYNLLLASLYKDQGRLIEAEKLYLDALDRLKHVSGEEHHILGCLSGLTDIFKKQGRWKEAKDLGIKETEMRIRFLGEEHASALVSQRNLALFHRKLEHWKEAKELELQVLEKSMKMLGEEHLRTLKSRENLATLYRKLEQWEEAEELESQVLKTSIEILGKDHDDILISKEYLADIYKHQERWREAEELYSQVIEASVRILGDEDHITLFRKGKLASLYRYLKRWNDAEALELQVMTMSIRTLGENHPDTLISKKNLKEIYKGRERWKEGGDVTTPPV